MIVELADEVTTSDNPDVLAIGCTHHVSVHKGNVARHESYVCVFDLTQAACAEHPRWQFIRPLLLFVTFPINVVPKQPLVRTGTHGDRANSGDFLAKVAAPVRVLVLYAMIASIALFGEFNLTEFIYFQF